MIISSILSSEQPNIQGFIQKWILAEDKAIAASKTHREARHNFLLGRAIVRAVLEHVTKRRDWNFIKDDGGKPFAQSFDGQSGPHFSLSHTAGWVACAVRRDGPVGIDMECWKPRDFNGLAAHAYGELEQKEVRTDGMPGFYRIWVLREAIAKATSDGLRLVTDGKDRVNGIVSEFTLKDDWQLYFKQWKPDCSLAIACQGLSVWSHQSLTWVNDLADRI